MTTLKANPNFIADTIAAMRHRRHCRQAVAQIREMEAHQVRDIGLSQAQVDDATLLSKVVF